MDQDPIPWDELRTMRDMDQEVWWRESLTPTALLLLAKLSRNSGLSYTDCVVGLIGDNIDLVRRLILEKKEKLDAQNEAPTE